MQILCLDMYIDNLLVTMSELSRQQYIILHTLSHIDSEYSEISGEHTVTFCSELIAEKFLIHQQIESTMREIQKASKFSKVCDFVGLSCLAFLAASFLLGMMQYQIYMRPFIIPSIVIFSIISVNCIFNLKAHSYIKGFFYGLNNNKPNKLDA